MIHFANDYTEGAHPKILERLIETNMEQEPGYGFDKFSENARTLIKEAIKNEEVDIHFLSGGTQANLTVIASSLRKYEGVVTADTGHIHNLETGAIEAVGHKLLLLPNEDGKISADQIDALGKEYWSTSARMHHVQPGMVYLSHPTETGTLYSKAELTAIRKVCDTYDMKLFIDGARLGYGLAAKTNNLSLEDLTNLTDVFYFGGTKIGALFGEAVIIRNEEIKRGFISMMKQKGGLLAKGRALGIQFEVLFEDNLYLEVSEYAITQAMRLKATFKELNIPLKHEVYTNQLFPILPKAVLSELQENYIFLEMEEVDNDNIVCRICTTWGTKTENVDALIKDLKEIVTH